MDETRAKIVVGAAVAAVGLEACGRTDRRAELMAKFNHVDKLVEKAIAEGVFPGAAYAVGHEGQVAMQVFGRDTYCPESQKRELDTIWDLASVSKVVGTTTGAMLLFDEGKLKLDQPVAEIVPAFGENGKAKITVRNLLLHDSGLAAFRPFHMLHMSPEAEVEAIYASKPEYKTGTRTIYSDLGMITFGKLIEALSGQTLDEFLAERVFGPLGMKATMYSPPTPSRARCASTEAIEPWRIEMRRAQGRESKEIEAVERQPDGNRWIKGEVHDPNATALGGVAGHAGLFSTVEDLASFMQMMLASGGTLVRKDTVKLFTTRKSESSSRAFGWDTKSEGSSAGNVFSDASYGHTGFTGTSVWADPKRDVFAVLLTNRVHPTAENLKIKDFRPAFHDAVMAALGFKA